MLLRALFALLLGAISLWGQQLKPLDVKEMGPGMCFAGSRVTDPQAGGFGASLNYPRRITKKIPSADGYITLIAEPANIVPWAGQYLGMPLYLVNRSRDTLAFAATDSQIAVLQEARDKWGQWHPVEYLNQSWCGNSLHRVFLPRNQYWLFVLPRYTGTFATKLRATVTIAGQTITSNEYTGRINPGQFKMSKKPWGY